MQRYLTHLLADLETATRNAPVASTYRFRHPFDEEDRDTPVYQMRYVRLCELFGLPSGIFPPSERLTKDQITALLTAIESLWRAWNVDWECPPRLTARRRYTIMVERMEDTIRYNHEFGAEINFCDRRADGICPFSDRSQCWCDELDACARHDFEIWESASDLDECAGKTPSPIEDFRRWLDDGQPDLPPWDLDRDHNRWQQFTADEDALAWLYFYDPRRGLELADETPEPSPEDFEDFEWHDEEEEDYGELPF